MFNRGDSKKISIKSEFLILKDEIFNLAVKVFIKFRTVILSAKLLFILNDFESFKLNIYVFGAKNMQKEQE